METLNHTEQITRQCERVHLAKQALDRELETLRLLMTPATKPKPRAAHKPATLPSKRNPGKSAKTTRAKHAPKGSNHPSKTRTRSKASTVTQGALRPLSGPKAKTPFFGPTWFDAAPPLLPQPGIIEILRAPNRDALLAEALAQKTISAELLSGALANMVEQGVPEAVAFCAEIEASSKVRAQPIMEAA